MSLLPMRGDGGRRVVWSLANSDALTVVLCRIEALWVLDRNGGKGIYILCIA